MIRVSNLDAAMLHAETPEIPMHTMGVLVLEPSAGPLFPVMRRLVEERIHLVAPFRRRLVQGPLQLGDPHWIEDPDFSLENHLRRAALPSPGGERELADFVGDLASRLLDRSKPLWEMYLVEGLEGGRVAVVAKIHHAAMDGGRLVALIGYLLDVTPDGQPTPPPGREWTPEKEPSILWLAADAARSLATRPLSALRALADMTGTMVENALPGRGLPHAAARVFEAPATRFNGALSQERVVYMADVALDDVRAVKKAFGTALNDVVLAATCGALRAWLLAHGGLPARPLVASVPVALQSAGDDAGGNHVSMILVHLPVQIEDPAQRLATIHAETQQAKKAHERARGDVLRQASDLLTNIAAPWVLTHAMEFYARSRLGDLLPVPWNLVVSNLAGPPVPLYCAGNKVLRIYPFGPTQPGAGLNLTVMSTMDRLCLGIMACKRLVPNVENIGTGFAAEIAALKTRAKRTR